MTVALILIRARAERCRKRVELGMVRAPTLAEQDRDYLLAVVKELELSYNRLFGKFQRYKKRHAKKKR